MVHSVPPEHRSSSPSADDAWKLSGSSPPRHLSHMKNFVRLVKFAWRYRVRFGLSIACAMMVALLFFTELGAVYPLLHILFDSQNPQRWVSEKIAAVQDEIVVLEARASEARGVLDIAHNDPRDLETIKRRLHTLHDDAERQGRGAPQTRALAAETDLKVMPFSRSGTN